MSDRPDLEVMWLMAFDDEKLRLRPEARRAVLREERCPRQRHLQAYVIASVYGPWVAWRSLVGARDVWSQDWLDQLSEAVDVTCHCNETRRVLTADLREVR